jgi:hypothetical protein
VHIKCSPAQRIYVTSSSISATLATPQKLGETITEAVISLENRPIADFIRVTVEDTTRHLAHTNAIWID